MVLPEEEAGEERGERKKVHIWGAGNFQKVKRFPGNRDGAKIDFSPFSANLHTRLGFFSVF